MVGREPRVYFRVKVYIEKLSMFRVCIASRLNTEMEQSFPELRGVCEQNCICKVSEQNC